MSAPLPIAAAPGVMTLGYAEALAARLVARLAPACERIEVAGSIRRQRSSVKDIEFVAVSRTVDVEGPRTLFEAGPVERVSAVWIVLEDLRLAGEVVPVKPGVLPFRPDDRWGLKRAEGRWFKVLYHGAAVDLFLTSAEAFGWTLLYRTGPAKVSAAYMVWAKRAGLKAEGGRLLRWGRPIATPEEADAFEALGLQYIDPELRVHPAALRPRRRA